MALRDPGAPRRNPLFVDESVVPDPDPVVGAPADDGWDDWADDPIFGGSDNPLSGAPGSAVGPFITALTEAGPEAAEHLVNAAHEFTLAIKVMVDAFEQTLAEQRATFASERGDEADLDLTVDDHAAEPTVTPSRLQSIDLE